MVQAGESLSSGIFAIFFQCWFMIETQVFMTLSNFLVFFSRNHFLEGASLFNGVVCFSVKRGESFLRGVGGVGCPMLVQTFCGGWGGGSKKVIEFIEWPPCPPMPPLPLWETLVNLHQKSVSLHQSVMFGINDYL